MFVREIQAHGLCDRKEQVFPLVSGEGEAVPDAVELAVGAHGILETAGLVDDRDRAVPHRHHLAQPAGLEPRRHQVEVGTGEDLGRHLLGIIVGETELAGIAVPALVEEIDIALFALSEDDQLNAEAHHLRKDLTDELNAFLLVQAGDGAEQREPRLEIETELLLQRSFALILAAESGCAEGVGQSFVKFRIIVIHVNTVQNTEKLVLDHVGDALQAHSVFREVELPGVGGGNGRDSVGHQHRAFHQVDVAAAFVLVAKASLVPAHRQRESVCELVRPELSLIGDVVDRVDAADIAKVRPPGLLILEVDHCRSGLPVVAVQDLGDEVQLVEQVDHCAGEPGKTELIIVVTVELGTEEEVLVVDEPDGDIAKLSAQKAAVMLAPAELDCARPYGLQFFAVFFLDTLVQGRDDRDLISGCLEGGREREGDVSKAAGFRERRAFARYKQDFHTLCSFLLR